MQTERLPIAEVLRRHIMRQNESEAKRHEKVPGEYHASQVWKCYRQAVYDWTGVTPTDEPPWGLFHMGKIVEEVGLTALREHYGPNFVHKVPVKYEDSRGWRLVGESDPVVFGWNNVPECVYEFKSSAAGAKSTPGSHYKRQAAIYGALLKVEEVRIAQPSRNDILNVGETLLSEDVNKLFSESVDYFQTLHETLEKQILPPAMPFMDWQCDYCSFKQQCVKDGGWQVYDHVITRGKNKGTVRKEYKRIAPAVEQEISESVSDSGTTIHTISSASST